MRVVGLISGGKDSIFNLLKCVDAGHEIVALANLEPADSAVEELDSFMYQTVGHRCVEAVAECMELPLFRRNISGTSLNTDMGYSPTEGDEVEDLCALLKTVVEAIPGVEGVSSGAVWSEYQKIRVENVCERLGLKSIALLWQYDQVKLLEEMKERQMEAIIIKTACYGVKPKEFLGQSVTSLIPKLLKLKDQFQINVAGEGGEYETLTLNCPLFHKKRLYIDLTDEDSCEVIVTDDDGMGTAVGHLFIKHVKICEK